MLRKEKGLTQEQLAEYLNVSGRSVSRWETGSNMPDLDILIILSDYYAVDIKELLDGERENGERKNGERKNEKMNTEQSKTILKAADYSNLKEKLLLKKSLSLLLPALRLGLFLLLPCFVLCKR